MVGLLTPTNPMKQILNIYFKMLLGIDKALESRDGRSDYLVKGVSKVLSCLRRGCLVIGLPPLYYFHLFFLELAGC